MILFTIIVNYSDDYSIDFIYFMIIFFEIFKLFNFENIFDDNMVREN